MRRVLPVLLAVALLTAAGQVALAEPSVSGLYYQTIKYYLGQDKPYEFASDYFFRLNVSGDAADNLSYFARLQGDQNSGVNLVRANVTYKNVGLEGLKVTVGRELVNWTRVNSFNKEWGSGFGSDFEYRSVDGLVLGYASGPVGVDAYYQVKRVEGDDPLPAQKPFSNEDVAARLTYSTTLGGLNLDLAARVRSALQEGGSGGTAVGAAATVSVPDIAGVYVEAGKRSEDDETFAVVGANIDVLKPATGIGAWVEYSVKDSKYAFSLSRELFKGFTLYVGGDNTGDNGELQTTITGEFSISF